MECITHSSGERAGQRGVFSCSTLMQGTAKLGLRLSRPAPCGLLRPKDDVCALLASEFNSVDGQDIQAHQKESSVERAAVYPSAQRLWSNHNAFSSQQISKLTGRLQAPESHGIQQQVACEFLPRVIQLRRHDGSRGEKILRLRSLRNQAAALCLIAKVSLGIIPSWVTNMSPSSNVSLYFIPDELSREFDFFRHRFLPKPGWD